MTMEDRLNKKSKRLKIAIENYNKYKSFADDYSKTHSLLNAQSSFIMNTLCHSLKKTLSEIQISARHIVICPYGTFCN